MRNQSFHSALLAAVAALLMLGGAALAEETPAQEGKDQKADAPIEKITTQWQAMFDGKSLRGWTRPVYGGDGEVTVKDGQIVMAMGESMTGVRWTGPLPKTNYEIKYEAQRVEGYDFFATATFPVGEKHCSFVTGGWGGTVVGISCVDYYDASDNVTSQFHEFKNKQWYTIRIRVTEPKVEVWVDDKQVVDLPRKDHKLDVRAECDIYKPFGLCSWMTTGAIRDVKIRALTDAEIQDAQTP